MATLLRVPEVAAGATEAVLAEWLVDENASFSVGQPIIVIETDKAVVEVEADTDAVLLRRLAAGGSTVEVGSPMALIGDESERGSDLDQVLARLAPGAQQAAPPPLPPPLPPAQSEPGPQPGARVFSTPIARRILAEAGLSAENVRGSGPNGRVLRRDADRAVEESRRAAAGGAAARDTAAVPEAAAAKDTPVKDTAAKATPVVAAGAEPVRTPEATQDEAGYEVVPHARPRRALASRLTASKQAIPHFYLRRTARIDALLALRAQLNDVSPTRISVNDLVLRAVAYAHVRVPDANVIWTEEGMRRFASVDVGVAIASDRGLVTPVVRGVEHTSPGAIAARVKAYVAQAGEGRLRQRDLEGGSITVTNLGMYGVEEFSAIINPPQSAILAVGAGRAEPVVVGTAVEVGTVMSLVLSVDHRAIDGALAARWMAELIAGIEEPLRLLA